MITLFLDYLLQCSLFLVLLYIPYLLFLRRETFFSLNRKYLLFALVISFVLPFVPLPNFSESVVVPEVDILIAYGDAVGTAAIPNQPDKGIDWTYEHLILGLYFMGVLFGITRLITALLSIRKLIKEGEKVASNGFVLVRVAKSIEPFSFLKWVFVAKKHTYSPEEETKILAHEKAHVQQLHSLDLLIAEFVRILLWFNPIVYVYHKALRNTHEYLADAETINEFDNKKNYLNLLVSQHLIGGKVPLANQFNHYSLLKKRVIMLTKSPSPKAARLKLFLTVPALLMCLFLTSCLKEYVEISDRSETAADNFASAFPEDYQTEKSFDIRRNTEIELDWEENKDYMIRIFPAENFEGVTVTLYSPEGEQLATSYLQERYFRGFTFKSNRAGTYRLKVNIPKEKKDTQLAIAYREFKTTKVEDQVVDEEGFTLVKEYLATGSDRKAVEYTAILSEGTSYKIKGGQTIKVSLFKENEEKERQAVFSNVDAREGRQFEVTETAVYYIRFEGMTDEEQFVNFSFKR